MRFCAFLMMPIVLLHQERSLEIVEPKNVTESACKTSVPSMTRGWMGVFFLRKSMIISFVLDMFSTMFKPPRIQLLLNVIFDNCT